MNIINRLTSPDLIFLIPAIIIGITVHEFSHAFMSVKLGDPTPKFQDRLTLNPLSHIDPFGLVALVLFGFGWGRPVQINPNYYKNGKRDRILVSLAGPLSNILVIIITAIIFRFTINMTPNWLWKLGAYIMNINAVLCVFNLLPIPPLDGSKILLEILPLDNKYQLFYKMQQYSMLIFILFLATGVAQKILTPGVNAILSIAMRIIW
ncbi:MAG: site-2 protease family protein [Halanaerobiales bacterium]